MSDWNKSIIEEFRANAGQVGGVFAGRPILLLHHTGAKSGKARVTPLMYQRLDGGYAVFGSKGGAPTNPDWFHNVKANPEVVVEVGNDRFDMTARVATGAEREAIWDPWKSRFGFFAAYERKTDRVIPVVVLETRT